MLPGPEGNGAPPHGSAPRRRRSTRCPCRMRGRAFVIHDYSIHFAASARTARSGPIPTTRGSTAGTSRPTTRYPAAAPSQRCR